MCVNKQKQNSCAGNRHTLVSVMQTDLSHKSANLASTFPTCQIWIFVVEGNPLQASFSDHGLYIDLSPHYISWYFKKICEDIYDDKEKKYTYK